MDAEDSRTTTQDPANFAGMVTIPFATEFIYSNGSALATSPMDVRITFAEILPDLSVKAKVGIVMSPEHAVQLVMNLMNQLVMFEHRFGHIRNLEWQSFRAKAEAEMGVAGTPPATMPPSVE